MSEHPDAARLQMALDAATEETMRLTRELVDAEETVRLLAELLSELVVAWREGGDLGPLVAEVETTLARLKQGH